MGKEKKGEGVRVDNKTTEMRREERKDRIKR